MAENKWLVQLRKPFAFEDKEYTEIDLSGMERLKIDDAIDAQRQLLVEQEEASMVLCETTTAFARIIAAKASDLPIELFKLLPRGASRQVTETVQDYMNTENKVHDHVMELEKPFKYDNKTYKDFDVSGVGDLNSMDESDAENRLARSGFLTVQTQFNILYACVLAAKATGLPEELFRSLPMNETAKLKNAVNDPAFFE